MEYSYMLVAESDKYPRDLKHSVFTDTRGDTDFPEFDRLLSVIQPNDSLHIPSLADLGYNLTQVCEKWQKLQDKEVHIWILDCPAAHSQPELFGEVLQYVCYSQKRFRNPKHRTVIREKNGSGPGRRRIELPERFAEVYEDYCSGKLNSREAGESLNVSHTTFLRWSRQLDEA
ncbi:hypothetical protein [Faecalibaculum rodentium]|uniref:hypothetical protein n=1 Tax=Faecalibaculum rodentium TaxID=1702221 RepID=UPI0023F1C5C3|nr:hypothetical protein [Faecalibaculum rodentium]